MEARCDDDLAGDLATRGVFLVVPYLATHDVAGPPDRLHELATGDVSPYLALRTRLPLHLSQGNAQWAAILSRADARSTGQSRDRISERGEKFPFRTSALLSNILPGLDKFKPTMTLMIGNIARTTSSIGSVSSF